MLIFWCLTSNASCCIFMNMIFEINIFWYTNLFFRIWNLVFISKYSLVKCKFCSIIILIYVCNYDFLNLKESECRILGERFERFFSFLAYSGQRERILKIREFWRGRNRAKPLILWAFRPKKSTHEKCCF